MDYISYRRKLTKNKISKRVTFCIQSSVTGIQIELYVEANMNQKLDLDNIDILIENNSFLLIIIRNKRKYSINLMSQIHDKRPWKFFDNNAIKKVEEKMKKLR